MNLSIIQRAAVRSFDALALPKGATVLDAPCGDGSLAATLRRAGYDAHGVDIMSAGTGLLGPAYHDVDLNGRLPFGDSLFDVVFSIERSLQPTSDMKGIISSIEKATKVDDHTVHLKTKGPNPILPDLLHGNDKK